MTLDRSTAPDSLLKIADVIGDELALRLCERLGGTRAYWIPKKPTPRHPFVGVIGVEALGQLCGALGGERLDIPRYHFRRLLKQDVIDLAERQPELTRRAIAKQVGCTEGYVQGVLRDAGHPRQLRLFEQ